MRELRSINREVYSASVPSSPPPSPVNRTQNMGDLPPPSPFDPNIVSDNDYFSFRPCPYFQHINQDLRRFTRSIPMSLNKSATFYSGPHSRGESSLELEAVAAVHQLSFAVQSISVSEMLPRTSELIFVNVTTMEGQPYCLELTLKGWRVTSLRSDCMQGDFRVLELFTKYYDSLYDLMEVISPGYKQRFNEKLEQRLRLLQTGEDGDSISIAPASSYIGSPVFGSPEDCDHSDNRSIIST